LDLVRFRQLHFFKNRLVVDKGAILAAQILKDDPFSGVADPSVLPGDLPVRNDNIASRIPPDQQLTFQDPLLPVERTFIRDQNRIFHFSLLSFQTII